MHRLCSVIDLWEVFFGVLTLLLNAVCGVSFLLDLHCQVLFYVLLPVILKLDYKCQGPRWKT